MVGNGSKQLTRLDMEMGEMTKMAKNGKQDWKWMDISERVDGNRWQWLEFLKMAGNSMKL